MVMLNSKDGHSGTYYEKHGGNYTKSVVKRLDWQLKGQGGQSVLFLDDEYLKMSYRPASNNCSQMLFMPLTEG